jgi:hypothetical protein
LVTSGNIVKRKKRENTNINVRSDRSLLQVLEALKRILGRVPVAHAHNPSY